MDLLSLIKCLIRTDGGRCVTESAIGRAEHIKALAVIIVVDVTEAGEQAAVGEVIEERASGEKITIEIEPI